jgi:hypothetical protein
MPTPPRVARFMRMIDHFERNEIEAAVDALIDHLDELNGDPDLEGSDAEDSFDVPPFWFVNAGPGCPIADTDFGPEDQGEPGNWPEIDDDGRQWTVQAYGDDQEDDGLAIRRPHRIRIQQTRCRPETVAGYTNFYLMPPRNAIAVGMGSDLL